MSKLHTFETSFDTYTVISQGGSGGSGTVYKVKNEEGKIFALKILSPENFQNKKLKRFKNELNFCKKSNHVNIIQIDDDGFKIIEEKKCPFYVMPYYNDTLRSLLEKKIPQEKCLQLFSQILDGIEAAHLKNTYHRDLKPENILYDQKTDKLVISDFGIAHFEEEYLATAIQTTDQERLANFMYAAPEQRVKGQDVDHKADIYSLGLMLNELFTNKVPLGSGFTKIATVVPTSIYLDEIVDWMTQQDPKKRPDSISKIKNELNSRGQIYISEQHLNTLKDTVIKDTDIDDPLIEKPIQIISVDDYNGRNNLLSLILSQNVTHKWLQAYQSIGGYGYNINITPELVEFSGNKAKIQIAERLAQNAIDLIKQYIKITNEKYRELIEREKRETKNRKEQELKTKIFEEERRLKLLQNLKI